MLRTLVIILTVVICVQTDSDAGCSKECDRTHLRVKRGKYYPGPPQRLYNRPPPSYPVKGAFSYTPPPFVTDEGPRYPGPRPYKVSQRPINQRNNGLGDEDINNLIKYLTKQDLDKIIDFAYEKQRNVDYSDNSKPVLRGHDKDIYKFENKKVTHEDDTPDKPYEVEFNKYINYVTDITSPKVYPSQEAKVHNINYLDKEETQPNNQAYTGMINTFTDSEITNPGNTYFIESNEEDKLPKPLNMKDDFEVSYTNNVPTVVQASNSYKVEDFGNLPLMNFYDSKLHSVSSYHVPHYTVTQPKPQSSLSSSSSSLLVPSPGAAYVKAPLLEPAPPISAAQAQSDAHLKATKIWSHKSKGTAYTLHDDGTLTLERPGWPKYG